MVTHKEKSAASRARIIQAAYDLFIEQGFTATSMRQIAARASLTLGGIYAQFANKEQIWSVVFFEHHPYRDILPLVEQAQGDTLEALLLDAARRLVASLGERADLLNLMFTEIVEFKGTNLPAISQEIVPRALHFMQRVYLLGGSRLRAIPPPVIARAYLGLFFSFYMTEKVIPSDFKFLFGSHTLEQFVDIFLHGILNKDAAHD